MIISEYLKQILICPKCSEGLLFDEKEITCPNCGNVGIINNRIISFPSSIKNNNQPAFYNDSEYKEAIKKLEELHMFHYDENSLSRKLENYLKSELMKIVVDPQRPFFDIGCGTGTGFKHLGYPEEIVGIDISFNLLKSCKSNYPDTDCICCDITSPPLKRNSLKTVFSLATLEHIFYLEHFIESVEKLLNHDGYYYVMIPTEGGVTWSILKKLSQLKFKYSRMSKDLNINYKKFIEKEHCNKADTIDNILFKFFKIDLVRDVPWRIGGTNLNLAKLYRLKKRT